MEYTHSTLKIRPEEHYAKRLEEFLPAMTQWAEKRTFNLTIVMP
jgi:hypothetical protein